MSRRECSLIPQYFREKSFPAYYKLVTLAVLLISLLPELLATASVIVLFLFYLVDNFIHKSAVRVGKSGIILAVFDLFCLCSIVWAKIKVDTAHAVFIGLCGLAVYLVIFNLSDTKEKIENIVLMLVGSAAANSLVGILQMLFMAIGKHSLFPSPLYAGIDIWFARLTNYPYFSESSANRVSGCFSNPLALSAFLVLVLPLAVFCSYYAVTKKRKIFSIVCSALIFFGLMFTFLRGTVVAVIFSLMMLSFAGRKPAKFMSVLAAFCSILMLVVIYLRRGITANLDLSTNYRIELWKTCIKGITEHPFGLGAGSENVRQYLFANGQYLENAHNLALELLLESGIIGFVIFAVVLFAVGRNLIRIFRCGGWYMRYAVAFSASLIGFLTMSMFEHTLCYPKEIIYFITVLGCVEALNKLARRSTKYRL